MAKKTQKLGIESSISKFNFSDKDVSDTLNSAKNITKVVEEDNENIDDVKEEIINQKINQTTDKDKLDKKIINFKNILDSEDYRDKKESFYFRLSKEALESYETLSKTSNYKLDLSINRNDIMRKVLENFLSKNFDNIIDELEKK